MQAKHEGVAMHDAISPKLAPLFGFLGAIAISTPAYAQNLGMTAHGGTLGLGVDVVLPVQSNFGLRAGVNYFPFDLNFGGDSIDYRLSLPSPQVALLADLYPVGQFRLSGGFLIKWAEYDVAARLTDTRRIGDGIYTPEEVGNLTGRVVTHDLSPYIGIGFGNPAAGRVGFFFDLGVAFHGNPQVSASADGPVSSDPGFQQDLAAEVQDLQDDLENIVVYPVLALGVTIQLGR